MSATQYSGDDHALHELIQDRTGLRLNDTQLRNAAAIVTEALASQPFESFGELQSILSGASIAHPLWRKLIHTVTVGETYFFRNNHQFEALRTEVLPALIAKRRASGNKRLRVWSAGCATGEEPYSLAILLRELLPDFETWQITLLATDINLVSLERARQAVYRARSFRSETPTHIRDRWFSKAAHGYEIEPTIRQCVIFQPLNLVTDDYPSFASGTMNMDLIVCRNVTIYFDRATTQAIVARFYRALADEGWLLVGHAESMAPVYQCFTACQFPNATLYQKTAPPLTLDPSPSTTLESTAKPDVNTHRRTTTPPERGEPGSRIALASGAFRQALSPACPDPALSFSAWQRAKQAADLEQWQAALTWLAQAEDDDKFQPQVYHLRALVQRHIGDSEGAIVSLRQAIYCDASFALAHYALGEIYESARRYGLAARHWRLAQSALRTMNPDEALPFADDMTVNMLDGLLSHRLSRLPARG